MIANHPMAAHNATIIYGPLLIAGAQTGYFPLYFFDGKIDGAVTEIANAVEQYDGFLDHILQR